MKALYLLPALLFFAYCKGPDVHAKLEAAIRKQYEDLAFKSNQKLTLLEITNVTYRMEGENSLDSSRFNNTGAKAQYYITEQKRQTEIARLSGENVRLYRVLESADLMSVERGKYNRAIEAAKAYSDSARQAIDFQQALMDRISKRTDDPRIYYRAEYDIKATMAGENLMARQCMFFDKDFNLVPAN